MQRKWERGAPHPRTHSHALHHIHTLRLTLAALRTPHATHCPPSLCPPSHSSSPSRVTVQRLVVVRAGRACMPSIPASIGLARAASSPYQIQRLHLRLALTCRLRPRVGQQARRVLGRRLR